MWKVTDSEVSVLLSGSIGWALEQGIVRDMIDGIDVNADGSELMVADFASGENNEVPAYFAQRCRRDGHHGQEDHDCCITPPVTVYCIDSHPLRLESLFHRLLEDSAVFCARVVHSHLEMMDRSARFPTVQTEYLQENGHLMTDIDRVIQYELRLPPRSFDLGILNNDVVGYLSEYYHRDVDLILEKIRLSVRDDGLLVVTQPCMLYRLDNISLLERAGLVFLEGYDLELRTNRAQQLTRDTRPEAMSHTGHFTSLVFKAD